MDFTLGEIMKIGMITNEFGKIGWECWTDIPNHYPECELDEFDVMSNHIHGIPTPNSIGRFPKIRLRSIFPKRKNNSNLQGYNSSFLTART
jgi:REP element-mobilizing transposase RayT